MRAPLGRSPDAPAGRRVLFCGGRAPRGTASSSVWDPCRRGHLRDSDAAAGRPRRLQRDVGASLPAEEQKSVPPTHGTLCWWDLSAWFLRSDKETPSAQPPAPLRPPRARRCATSARIRGATSPSATPSPSAATAPRRTTRTTASPGRRRPTSARSGPGSGPRSRRTSFRGSRRRARPSRCE